MSIFGLKSKKGTASINLPHYDGVPNFPKNWASELILHDSESKLEIRPRLGKMPSVYLPYNKIVGVVHTTEKEISEKGKSVLGRAAIGGVLLGPLGAIVGGISGTGKKEKSNLSFYVVINYKPDLDSEDIKVLCFKDNTIMNAAKFINMLKERAGLLNNNIQEEINL